MRTRWRMPPHADRGEMSIRGILTMAALAAAATAAGAGCAALYHGGPGGASAAAEAAPDSSSMRLLISNQNDETVRLILERGSTSAWLTTVPSMPSQAINLPADIPGGGGGITIRVRTLNGQEWDARGILPNGGTTIRLDIDHNLRMSTWTQR